MNSIASLTIERVRGGDAPLVFAEPVDAEEWLALLGDSTAVRVRGRPVNLSAGMNAMVWEYGLLRYVFARYWPKRQRPVADEASAASIAVARCRAALRRELRDHPTNATTYRTNYAEQSAEMRRLLLKEWDCGMKSAGRKQAAADIAYLDTLPAHCFTE